MFATEVHCGHCGPAIVSRGVGSALVVVEGRAGGAGWFYILLVLIEKKLRLVKASSGAVSPLLNVKIEGSLYTYLLQFNR